MQVAIVSTNGINVDEHFGRAERFLIYKISGDNQTLLAVKVSGQLSEGDRSHEFNGDKFSEIADILSGCERVYCTRIGEQPAEELKKIGIEPVIDEGPIEKITV
ncbi:MAG: NifB/NifX family molybdenum-iron cluster-binding protein [Thermodesulfobacteriota bacterium]